MKRRVADWLTYVAFRCALCVMQTMSLESADALCRTLASIIDRTPLRRKTIDENIQLVFGEVEPCKAQRLRRGMWHNLLLMVFEIVHAPRKIHRTNWRQHFVIRNREQVFELLMDRRPTILVTGHFGNFELAGYATGLFGVPSTTIARPLDNPHVHQFITNFRSLGGQHMLPKDGSAPAVQQILNEGGTLALLADQFAGPKGVWVDFLGHPTSCHKALALFVLSSRAPMVVCYNRRLKRPLQFEMAVTGIADPNVAGSHLESVAALTRWYNQCLEQAIRKAPEQYWWLHRRWRDAPPRRSR